MHIYKYAGVGYKLFYYGMCVFGYNYEWNNLGWINVEVMSLGINIHEWYNENL